MIPPPPASRGKRLYGALVAHGIPGGAAQVTIPFQYNPEALSRNLQLAASTRARGNKARATTDIPDQTIDLEIQIESVFSGPQPGQEHRGDDGYAKRQGPEPRLDGLRPHLAALEMLSSPNDEQFEALIEDGKLYAVPAMLPRLFFVWGPGRILPVTLEGLKINEKIFNARLEPTCAEVSLSLRVVPYWDTADDQRGALSGYLRGLKRAAKSIHVEGAKGKTYTGVLVPAHRGGSR